MKLYVAGPMTSWPDHNLPAFAAATVALHEHGYDVVNPGRHGVIPGYTWSDYVRRGLHELLDCQAVAVLPEWQASRGAGLEPDLVAKVPRPHRHQVDLFTDLDDTDDFEEPDIPDPASPTDLETPA